MKILCLGGGPAGLYFALLMKKAAPAHQVTVIERNRADQTFGWGVVFSDETLGYLEESDPESHQAITRAFIHWDRIDIHFRGQKVTSGGHGFAGLSRQRLLSILQERCRQLGVDLLFERDVTAGELAEMRATHDLVVAADGVRSIVRQAHADVFEPDLDVRPNRYIWLGTHRCFDAFTFLFEETAEGFFQVHAYRFDQDTSTFIIECDDASFQKARLGERPVEDGLRYFETLFAPHLQGHPLLSNRSTWINFVTVRNRRWHHGNTVLLGDAAHTAHFSIGSGTKLALEDAIALHRAFGAAGLTDGSAGPTAATIAGALQAYEDDRRGIVERTQKAAQDSLAWFEQVKRYRHFHPVPFAFSLLTRSKKITYSGLQTRDPAFVSQVSDWYVRNSSAVDDPPPASQAPPPMFTPFRLRGLQLRNRVVVSPMCMYSADDGTVNDFHLVHLGARAQGGAGLLMTEMTDVMRDGRITPGCAGMYRPEHVQAWARIVDFVHKHSRAAIGLQLAHAGRKGSTRLMWKGIDEPLPDGNWPLISASPLPYLPHSQVPREMTRRDMDEVREAFVRATRWAVEAGFDLVELHLAHGYLLSSFISPLTNVRTDEYGGSLANRLRFPLEVVEAVREVWPGERPLSARISAHDWAPGGLVPDDAVEVARALQAAGCDIIDVSSGQTTAEARPVYGRMFQTPFSDQIRNELGLCTMAVGNITTADQINSILASGRADLCLLARGHLADPYFTLHAAAEQGFDEQDWPVQYGPARPRPRPR
jgi:anthraniloyl-CoA monooxygenase